MAKMTDEHKARMREGAKKAREAIARGISRDDLQKDGPGHPEAEIVGKTLVERIQNPLKAIRLKCLDCGGTDKVVKYCSMDGLNSTRCPLWPYRFGKRPATARKKYGDALLSPKDMPPANMPLEELP